MFLLRLSIFSLCLEIFSYNIELIYQRMKYLRRIDSGGGKYFTIIFCCILVCIPFLMAKFPPISDLPQHTAQIRLFQEALSKDNSIYKVQWITPYSLVYGVLGIAWIGVGPENAGRIAMLLLAVLWVLLVHVLARKKKRPPASAVLASIFFFSHIVYWGFYQFLFGWIVFMGWVLFLEHEPLKEWKEIILNFLFFVLLYYSHILWFFVGVGWLVLNTLIYDRKKIKLLIYRLAAAIPFMILMLVWYPSLSAYGFRSQTIWATNPLERISYSWFVDAAFGGIKGNLGYILFSVVLIWIVFALWQNRKSLKQELRFEFLLLAFCFLFGSLILPDKMVNTIRFSQRWVPPAIIFLLLGIPVPKIKKEIRLIFSSAVVIFFIIVTTVTWLAFEKSEMSGFEESLNKLPENPMVIGLDYVKESQLIRGRPFIQTFAYAQVLRGGELNFSFADFGPSLVVYKKRRHKPWTRGLEWFPERAKVGDFRYFDYALINAYGPIHNEISSRKFLNPIVKKGRWRLYDINYSSINKKEKIK